MPEPTTLPNWVYDLVMELQQQQDTHPELLVRTYPTYEPEKYDWCPCRPLDFVPEDVKDRAEAIAAYRREAEKDKEPADA